MTDAPTSQESEPPPPPAPSGRRLLRRRAGVIALWAAGALAGVVALALAAILALDTGPGHRLLAAELARQRLSNGLSVRIGRIDGSIYGRMALRDVTVSDLQGRFARTPALVLDWRPLPLLFSRHVVIEALSADAVDLERRPLLKAALPRPNQPILPSISITVKRLNVGALTLEPPVDGKLRRVGLAASADFTGARASLDLAARALQTPQQGGGDRLAIRLDAWPKRDRLVLEAHAYGPAGGVIGGLAGTSAPLSLDLAGGGTWKLWRGRVEARVGARSLLSAGLSEAAGVYAAQGQAAPGLLIGGAAARLADPSMAFDLAGSMAKQVVQLKGAFSSPELSLALAGGVGLGDSTFRQMQVRLRLAHPEAVSPQLSGADVAADLVLDGPIARPGVDYDLAARSLGYDGDTLEALKASGRVQLGTGSRLQLRVHAAADRLSAPGRLAGLLTGIRLDGDVAGAWTGAAKGRIDLRSSGLTLAADVSGSTRTNRYAALAKGRLEAAAVKAFGLDRVLGGAADFSGDFASAPGVTVQVKSLQLTAPALKVTTASGELRASGALALQASAVSAPYGPFAVTAGGSLQHPTAHLTAAHPRLGVQLTNLDATLTRPGTAYQIAASAGTPYGPAAADFALTLGPGPMAVDLRRGALAGLAVAGRLVRTTQGPFAGALQLDGDGFGGQVRLSPDGTLQQADVALRAQGARLPLKPAVTITSGVVNGRVVLTPGQPQVTATADLEGVGRAGLQLAAARAEVELRGGSGRAVISARGTKAQPFDLVSAISIAPNAFTVDAHGAANRLAFHLLAPARVVKAGQAWRLEPATVVLPGGRVDASGTFGDGLSASLRLEQADLGMVDAFDPSLGIGGAASGSIDVSLPAGAAQPQGRALLQLTGLTRSGPATISEPVDVDLLGSLAGAGAELDAVVRRRGAVVGRLQGRLSPAAAGPDWIARFRAGALSGGVRYDGPAEALWALSGVTGQEVSGPIAIGVDASGRVDAPQLRGVIRAQDLRYENAAYGTRIDHLAVQGSFAGTRFQLASLSGKAGSGTISGSGYVDLSLADGLPVALKLTLDKAQLARGSDLSAAVSGQMEVANSRAAGGLISGSLTVNNARLAPPQEASSQVVTLQGVHLKGQPLSEEEGARAELPISRWKLDVRVRADNQIFVNGMGLDSEWRANLHVGGDINHPLVVGDVTSIRGTYAFAGRQLQLTDGLIHLNGSIPPDPTLNITASSTVNDVTAIVNVAGTAQDPQITFSSTPSLPQDEVLSRLLFGAATPQLSPLQAVQLAASLNALRGGHGLDPLGKLRQAIGVENLAFTAGSNGQGAGVGVGKYLTSRIYVQVTTDTRGFVATQIQVALTKTLNLLSQVSSLGTSNLSVQFSHRY